MIIWGPSYFYYEAIFDPSRFNKFGFLQFEDGSPRFTKLDSIKTLVTLYKSQKTAHKSVVFSVGVLSWKAILTFEMVSIRLYFLLNVRNRKSFAVWSRATDFFYGLFLFLSSSSFTTSASQQRSLLHLLISWAVSEWI